MTEEKKNEFEALLENSQEEDGEDIVMQNEENDEEAIPSQPSFASPAWVDYVKSQFRESELRDNNPTCAGCRRLVEELIGPIYDVSITQYTPINADNRFTATVCVAVSVYVTNETHPLYPFNNTAYQYGTPRLCVEDIADVSSYNTQHPYHLHASATAATRAEGRCYRKLLRLTNIITAEESAEQPAAEFDSWEVEEGIQDAQINTINIMCKRLDIDVLKFINSGSQEYVTIQDVSKHVAAKMLRELNKIQRGTDEGGKEKPSNVSGYDPNWRNANASST